jgi:hypothetical protein
MKSKEFALFCNALLDQILGDDALKGNWSPIQSNLDALRGALMERALAGE